MDEHTKRSDFVQGFKGARDSILCYISKTNTAGKQHILTSNKSKLHSRHFFFVFIKIHLKLLQVSPDNLLFLYRVMAELCGIKRNISKSISSTTEINIWVQIFPPLQKSTSEFKFSPNLYKINCTWSMESFYVGSVTDTFSSDFEWFFLTITGQICIKYKKLSIKTKLTDIDKARNWWFDFWQYISCDKCDVQLMKTDQLKCWIANQLKSSAGQLLNCWAPDQMHKTTGHQLKRGPWCSFNQHVILFYSNFVLPPNENLYKLYIYILRYAPPHLLLLK